MHMRNHTAYKNLRTREETEDKDEAERAHQRHADAEARSQNENHATRRRTKISVANVRGRDASDNRVQRRERIHFYFNTNQSRRASLRPARDGSEPHFNEKATARIEKNTFAAGRTDALARDIDTIESELKN